MQSTIGVTGPMSSGKGAVAELLKPLGFVHVSLSDEVRREAERRGLPLKRETLQGVGDSLRKEFGKDVLARRIASTIDEMRRQGQARSVLIDSIRSPGELKWLKDNYGTFIIGVTAADDIRIEREIERLRSSNQTVDIDAIQRAMQRDRGIGQAEHGNQVDACLALADVVVINNGTLEDLNNKLREILAELGVEGTLPNKEGKS